MANVNPNESEHERQFREDLEKATALSMETLALDQFRRNKLYSSDSISEQQNNPFYGSTCKCPQPELRELSLMLKPFQLNLTVVLIHTIQIKLNIYKIQLALAL